MGLRLAYYDYSPSGIEDQNQNNGQLPPKPLAQSLTHKRATYFPYVKLDMYRGVSHNITNKGIQPLEDKVSAMNIYILNFPEPNISQLRRILTKVNFYRRFILPAASKVTLFQFLKGATKGDKRLITWAKQADLTHQK
ncbi:hypothetical protein TNIN_326181 [Trichonephila inaurata madagascariensis]|uniref:Uncharacterized protein n=1 Tax=Trichonephila inaurata madagascariensis TaxID=2747483 RepID=A0A8X6YPB6_9ARAC|nr:hypothetical protein TNIN_326181 [Trichonephila inaurata madagascariensis]